MSSRRLSLYLFVILYGLPRLSSYQFHDLVSNPLHEFPEPVNGHDDVAASNVISHGVIQESLQSIVRDVQTLGNRDEGSAQIVETELDTGRRRDLVGPCTRVRNVGPAASPRENILSFIEHGAPGLQHSTELF